LNNLILKKDETETLETASLIDDMNTLAPDESHKDECLSGVKTCPICGEGVFADMQVCFGCMHAFAEDNVKDYVLKKEEPADTGSGNMQKCGSNLFNEFLIEFHRFLGEFLVNRVVDLQ
jgi:hypothetical protein